ncbi:hypothetical protein OIDMADRAFT_183121 [Oidiodendron maius Zn]|uniref:Srp40 C-terminal domain-containing protein n=1 Tax=Oidiodendron maius (strain Zn) TaxID=913774 RepID=A0A0C3D319_OIDMZ|nr:hypothetical protein OIDMADRAFT_183121 [Oidiodendron maius Zn]
MSGNPNKQKMGKRKGATAKQQPDWLFPGAGDSSNDALAKKSGNNNPPANQSPPSELVGLVEAFLAENQYTNTSQTFAKENKARGQIESNINYAPSLSAIYNEWRQLKRGGPSAVEDASKQHVPLKSIKKDVSSSDSDSSSETSSDENDSDVEMADTRPINKEVGRKSSSSASSSSSSDSDADDENETPVIKASSPKKPKVNTLKRKEHPDTNSSSSDSDSDSTSESSSEDEAPKAKKAKTDASSSSEDSSDSSSASESDSDSSSENKTAKTKQVDPEPISSGSESSSESDSDSDSSTHSIAQKVPLPESDSVSTSDSDSDSDSDNEDNKQTSDTSATLSDHAKKSASSAESSSGASSSGSEIKPKVASKAEAAPLRKLSPPLPPNPVKDLPRKTNERFSRIPQNIQVDQRLASNAYVPYDYAQRAHEDLIVTKGKGFTKEKNKKKRGSYRGGYIDVEGKKGIKFDD